MVLLELPSTSTTPMRRWTKTPGNLSLRTPRLLLISRTLSPSPAWPRAPSIIPSRPMGAWGGRARSVTILRAPPCVQRRCDHHPRRTVPVEVRRVQSRRGRLLLLRGLLFQQRLRNEAAVSWGPGYPSPTDPLPRTDPTLFGGSAVLVTPRHHTRRPLLPVRLQQSHDPNLDAFGRGGRFSRTPIRSSLSPCPPMLPS